MFLPQITKLPLIYSVLSGSQVSVLNAHKEPSSEVESATSLIHSARPSTVCTAAVLLASVGIICSMVNASFLQLSQLQPHLIQPAQNGRGLPAYSVRDQPTSRTESVLNLILSVKLLTQQTEPVHLATMATQFKETTVSLPIPLEMLILSAPDGPMASAANVHRVPISPTEFVCNLILSVRHLTPPMELVLPVMGDMIWQTETVLWLLIQLTTPLFLIQTVPNGMAKSAFNVRAMPSSKMENVLKLTLSARLGTIPTVTVSVATRPLTLREPNVLLLPIRLIIVNPQTSSAPSGVAKLA